jgi:hypothetical protein
MKAELRQVSSWNSQKRTGQAPDEGVNAVLCSYIYHLVDGLIRRDLGHAAAFSEERVNDRCCP